ncbi:cytochrome b [Polynucleobacter sp. MWH-Creno-3A4]|uniref:cytochrome b n=1 Tax=Polynucleobacter sp. MWH-Creno-3A4 TaxID=1855886 RepID=UPI001C0D14E0|nr:cytochrome b [Polynucleobacter sp. MWH-Creno-3A4]MBU3606377.1 cytochrome b [Polynucleobacter sp. MWH-Creno-3A4]
MSSTRYHPASIFFHWFVFLLVLAALAVIELKGQFPKGSEPRELCKTIHAFFGQLIFVAMIGRLTVRCIFGAPEPTDPNRILLTLAKLMHWVLYALLLALPIMGVIFLQAGGKEVHFLSWVWPQMISPNPEVKDLFKEAHEFLGNAIFFLVGIHALAGLWHHYVLKDDTLRRMLNKIKVNT